MSTLTCSACGAPDKEKDMLHETKIKGGEKVAVAQLCVPCAKLYTEQGHNDEDAVDPMSAKEWAEWRQKQYAA